MSISLYPITIFHLFYINKRNMFWIIIIYIKFSFWSLIASVLFSFLFLTLACGWTLKLICPAGYIRFICSCPSCHMCSCMLRAYFYIVSRLSAKHVVILKWCFGVVLSHWSAVAHLPQTGRLANTRPVRWPATPPLAQPLTHKHTNTMQTDSYKYLTDSSRRCWRRLRRRKRFMNFFSSICLW